MPNDSFVQVPPDSSGKLVDHSNVTTGSGAVQRQRIVVGDDVGNLASVTISGDLQVDLRPLQRLAYAQVSLAAMNLQANSPSGFIPMEIPTFLGGF